MLKDPPIVIKDSVPLTDSLPFSLTSPRPTLSRSALGVSTSKTTLLSHPLNPDWAARVLDQEQRELAKLESILAKERAKAEVRRRALDELEAKEEWKTKVVQERVREREVEIR